MVENVLCNECKCFKLSLFCTENQHSYRNNQYGYKLYIDGTPPIAPHCPDYFLVPRTLGKTTLPDEIFERGFGRLQVFYLGLWICSSDLCTFAHIFF